MSNDSLARRTDVLVSINGADISEDMRGYLLSVSYTDEEEDKTDDINVQLDDRDGIWLKNWLNSSVTSRAASGGSGFSVGDNVMVKQGATD
ncbi:MAG: hypothetical protein E7478_02880, partial [Ruminococcaceae bacterium]|nr:hypothetical protein [Oscillospiraceae bacterium]